MPLTLPPSLSSALQDESLTLATLWEITRLDGAAYYYTDHDKDIVFAGQTYTSGVGYDRSAIEDKSDFSSDNMDVRGILFSNEISREDIRGGLFDGAEVWIRIVDWSNPDGGSIVRRRGWLGEVRQNNLGQFSAELRGLQDTFSEDLSRVYTPGCVADLGSTTDDSTQVPCGRKLEPDARQEGTAYAVGDEVVIPEFNTDLVYRCTTAGTTETDAYFDFYAFDLYEGETVSDGTVVWTAFPKWVYEGSVNAAPTPDRRTFEVLIPNCPKIEDDPRYFDGGLLTFLDGDNENVSREIKSVDLSSDGALLVTLYLRMPFNVNAGDTAKMYPGCDKTLSTCQTKFANSINFKGFPHVPGDDFLKQYPDSKR